MNQFNKEKVQSISEEENSDWKDLITYIEANGWLDYSSEIARRIIAKIRSDKDLSQVKLAELLGVEPQQISKIVKGKENLTLKTIWNLSKALNIQLISFPEYEYSKKFNETTSKKFEAFASMIMIVRIDENQSRYTPGHGTNVWHGQHDLEAKITSSAENALLVMGGNSQKITNNYERYY